MNDVELFEFNTRITGGIPFEITPTGSKDILRQLRQPPRRDTFYVIFWIESGDGSYFVDFQQYPISGGMLFCVVPGQVHYWDVSTPLIGTAILFMPDFLVANTLLRFPQDFSIFDWNTPAGYQIDSADHTRIRTLIQILADEYVQAEAFQKIPAIQNALLLLLIHMQRVSNPLAKRSTSSGDVLLHDFIELVNTHYVTHRKVQDYAHMLGVSPGHLSDTVSSLTGQTAISVIHQRTVLEAKRTLIHTDQTVSQIATMLSFDDPSYFGRFFKRIVGETPHQFRQKFR